MKYSATLDGDAVEEQEPCCGKCGALITTGAMALFCPAGKDCEFWVPAVEDFKRDFPLYPPRSIDRS